MGLKLAIGEIINNGLDRLIKWDYRSVTFIPNGRLVPLDIKRARLDLKVIFDVGANIGLTANSFAEHFPEAEIYCFEPVLNVYNELIANTTNTKIKCFNKALGAENANAKIYKPKNYSGTASIKGINESNLNITENIEISTGKDICSLCQISYIDLLKIDTEGYELEVLEGFKSMLQNQIKLIYVEVGFDQNDECSTYITKLLEYLTPYGFIITGFYDQYRIGNSKLKLNHCDILLINTNLINI